MSSFKNNKAIKNFSFLLLSNGISYLIPLFTFPYTIRVIGIELYGQIIFAKAIMAYFVTITDYGFDLSATRNIALNRDNQKRLVEIYSAVFIIKFLLMLICLLFLLLLIFFIPKFHENSVLFFITFLMVVNNFLMPKWFFQGLEEMGYITILEISSRILFAALIFTFVREKSDYLFVPVFTELGGIISGLMSLCIISKKFKVNFSLIKLSSIKKELFDGFHIFVTRIYFSLYYSTSTVFLGWMANPVTLGQYAIADQILSILEKLFDTANQAIYPNLAHKFKSNIQGFYRLVIKLNVTGFFISVGIILLTFLLADPIITLISGHTNQEIKTLLLILLLSLTNKPLRLFYTSSLIIINKTSEYQKIMFVCMLLNFIILFPSVLMWEAIGLAITRLIISIIISLLLLLLFHSTQGSFYKNQR